MRETRHFSEHGIGRRHIVYPATAVALRQDRAREPISERRLAHAFRPHQEPRMMHAAALKRAFELGGRLVMSEDTVDVPWRGERVEAVGLDDRVTRTLGRGWRMESRCTIDG